MASNHNILLDSCVYFRLAEKLHPIIGTSFGANNYRCYLHTDFNNEFEYNEKLEKKFEWVIDKKYEKNRNNLVNLSKDERHRIDIAYSYLNNLKVENGFSTCYYDLRCLATAYIKGFCIATDDYGLYKLSNIIKVKKFNSIELLNLMRANKLIDEIKIKEVIIYWKNKNDLPRNHKQAIKKILKMEYDKIIKDVNN